MTAWITFDGAAHLKAKAFIKWPCLKAVAGLIVGFLPSSSPGNGLAWNGDVVAKFQLT